MKNLSAEDKAWVLEKEDGYYCDHCIQHHGKNPFGGHLVWISKPCLNHDMADAVRKHKNSQIHNNVVDALGVAEKKSICEHIIEANESLLNLFTARIRNVFWLFKHHLGLNLACDLLDLTSSHGGLKDSDSLLQGHSQQYNSHEFFSEIQLCIANVIRSDLLKELKDKVRAAVFTRIEESF
jgi:hypothetical protein